MSKKRGRKNKNRGTLYAILIILLLLLIALGLYWWMQHRNRPQSGSAPLDHIRQAEMAQVAMGTPEQLLYRAGYTVSYNPQWRQPNWVSYELLESELAGKAKRSDKFITDKEVKGTRVEHKDYTRSGYDRGHMAPAADMKWSKQAMEESFLLSNICPQTPELNRGRWKELEELIREWTVKDSALLIACGPIVPTQAKTIGKNQVKVPTRFFKAVVAPYRGEPRGIAFLFENNNERQPALHALAVPIDSVECASGIDLFYNLPDNIENKIESNLSLELWNLY